MGQISNTRRIIVEDFAQEDRDAVAKLSSTLNPFMDEIIDVLRNNLDYENLNRSKIVFDVVVDATGKPNINTQINTGLSSFSGKHIIDVAGVNSASDVVISTPYLDCTYQGNGIVRINRVLGLPASKKMRVTVEFIG